MKRIVYDVDNTLTLNLSDEAYSGKPISPFISPSEINSIAADEICYFTARNMLSLNEDLALIRSQMVPTLQDWLLRNNLPEGEIYIGKPYCGEQGIYVDDKAIGLNGHKLSVASGLINLKLCIVISIYNARNSIDAIFLELIELSTMCPDLKVIIVDNGSADSSGDLVCRLADAYPFVSLVSLSENIGYGGGVKAGISFFRESISDHEQYSLIISHGNSKFPVRDFVKGIARSRSFGDVCYVYRVNRPMQERLITWSLLFLFRIFGRLRTPDCIGASRYLPSVTYQTIDFDAAPDDYLFDIWLSMRLRRLKFQMIPQLQNQLIEHKSSWRGIAFPKLRMSLKYLSYLVRSLKSFQ